MHSTQQSRLISAKGPTVLPFKFETYVPRTYAYAFAVKEEEILHLELIHWPSSWRNRKKKFFLPPLFPCAVVGTTESLNHVVSTAPARSVWYCGGGAAETAVALVRQKI